MEAIRSHHGTEFRALGSGRVRAVISTGNLARDGAIIETAGWDFANYRRNPVVLWAHQDGSHGTSSGMPIARTVAVGVEGDTVVAEAQFDLKDDFAVSVLRKIEKGFLRATSVRWRPLQFERRSMTVDGVAREVVVFTRQELLEWSPVAIPADPGALVVRAAGRPPLAFASFVAQLLDADGSSAGVAPPRPAVRRHDARMLAALDRLERATRDYELRLRLGKLT